MRPIVGIPMGDPAGIGPEIALKALNNPETYNLCRPIIIGDGPLLTRAAKICGLGLDIRGVASPAEARFECGAVDYIQIDSDRLENVKFGAVQAAGGLAAFRCIERSVALALAGDIDAVATTPINKESLRAAGIDYIGHTEIYAGLTGTDDPLTLFEVRGMRVFFLTRHVSLKRACEMVTKERLLDYITRCHEALKSLGAGEGVMAVAGLNPHSGEHGLFGNEEVEAVSPAVAEAQRLGYRVEGPIGADSVFHLALKGRFNSVLSLYHDQGHIATKTLDFERTIALTLGLPFLRASVDHGTAFDIAGTGIASEISMIEAISIAAKYALSYKNHQPDRA